MKLTDEQIDHIKGLMKIAIFKDTRIADHILQLIADRQAWKEEAERYAGVIKILERDALDANAKLNKAVEVLKFYSDEATYDIEHLDKHGYIIIDMDGGEKAREFLSSLSQEGTIHD